jgi:hypothetical protein
MLAQTLIKDAFRLIGVTRIGQTPSPEALGEGLAMLNAMIDAWSIERLMIPVTARQVLNLVANQQTYTIGPAADWEVPRPVRIERAGLVSDRHETPMDTLSLDQWVEICVKDQVGLPSRLYYDGAYPLGNVSLWPVPEDASLKVALYCWSPVVAFADLATTEYDLPPGYEIALRFNLAEYLMPAFTIQNKSTMQQHGMVIERAREQKAWIKMLNTPFLDMKIDPALTGDGGFDIVTGEYR